MNFYLHFLKNYIYVALSLQYLFLKVLILCNQYTSNVTSNVVHLLAYLKNIFHTEYLILDILRHFI